ncbi:MAG TPA: pentapeptide repeat-containing protein, partial [Terriglobia bacterium]|nr:pentapeptide repeat-containing protein [Terriglobia bacterium]
GNVEDGLQPAQLAGADLTGAKLPGPIDKLFEDLDAVNDISAGARTLFVTLLAACVYSWLTIATTTDVNLITNRATSPLPIIQTSIPIAGFYVVAPLLLLCVYFYFHLYLQKLWEELGSLPAIFTDGRPLYARSDPWLLNDLVRAHLARLKADRPFMSYFQQAISLVLAWWLVPITLLMFWGRYLPRHDYNWLGTKFHVALLAISIAAAGFLYSLASGTLRGAVRRPFSWWRVVKSGRAYSALAILVAIGAGFALVSVGAIWGVRSGQGEPASADPWPAASGRYSWAPRAMALLHCSPFANLRWAEVSVKPANWTGKDPSQLDFVTGVELSGADLRDADASHAFLAKAILVGAHLEGALLSGAVLDGAHLQGADLNGAYLRQAHLSGAALNEALLTRADLTGAGLAGADLRGAGLGEADLSSADLTGANLTGADLTAADLTDANLKFAYFLFVKGITPQALKQVRGWDQVYYDPILLQQLGLSQDHNSEVEQEQKREEQQSKNPPAAGGPVRH